MTAGGSREACLASAAVASAWAGWSPAGAAASGTVKLSIWLANIPEPSLPSKTSSNESIVLRSPVVLRAQAGALVWEAPSLVLRGPPPCWLYVSSMQQSLLAVTLCMQSKLMLVSAVLRLNMALRNVPSIAREPKYGDPQSVTLCRWLQASNTGTRATSDTLDAGSMRRRSCLQLRATRPRIWSDTGMFRHSSSNPAAQSTSAGFQSIFRDNTMLHGRQHTHCNATCYTTWP